MEVGTTEVEETAMGNDRKRHDLSNEVWAVLEPYMSEKAGQWKRASKDNRQFINGMFWILRTGASWRDLPPCHGKWGHGVSAIRRWRDNGQWQKFLEIPIDEPDFEWLMIDASHCKVHPHAAGARGGNQGMSRTKEAQHQDSPCCGCE